MDRRYATVYRIYVAKLYQLGFVHLLHFFSSFISRTKTKSQKMCYDFIQKPNQWLVCECLPLCSVRVSMQNGILCIVFFLLFELSSLNSIRCYSIRLRFDTDRKKNSHIFIYLDPMAEQQKQIQHTASEKMRTMCTTHFRFTKFDLNWSNVFKPWDTWLTCVASMQFAPLHTSCAIDRTERIFDIEA